MTTILIADDEKLERNGIKLLLKREGAECEILEAENGKVALGILMDRKVDILFSDIKMPYMNGLELTEKARELYPDLEIIIFSGYNDFTYARDALRYGVVDYVLKPVNPKEFHKTFERVQGKIQSRIEDEEKQTRQGDYLKKYFLQNYLYKGNVEDYQQVQAYAQEMTDEKNPYIRMIIASSTNHFFETEEEHFVESLKEKLKRDFFYLNLNSNESLFLFREKYADYEELANQLNHFFQQHYDTNCYFAVSREVSGIQEMPEEFQQLEQLLEEKFYQPKQHIFVHGKKVESTEDVIVEDSEILNNISEDIKFKDITHLWQDFHRLEQKYTTDKPYSEMYAKFVFSSILKEVYEAMSSSEEKRLSKKVDQLYHCKTIQDVRSITSTAIQELENYLQEQNEGFRSEITEVKSYIYHNYEKELNVEILAEKVYLSAGYLSAIFKEATGMNLNRFIREVRMNKAKELLENSTKKITQIAREVGFSNTSYFCRSFREFFGSTPESCRKGEMDDKETEAEV